MENKVTKITRTTEYIVACEKCKKRVVGSKESQVRFLLKVHQDGKESKK